jgi:hypothetical protein
MDKESLELQQKLLDKMEEWRNSPEFGASKYDMQKYKRAKGMLQATHPTVLTEVLGITSVPDIPKESMNRIRTMDLSSLKKLEIFRGLDDKVVGHHMSAFGAISGALDNQSPERRLELLNRAIDSGYKTGMDTTGIGPIRTSIHKPIAHQGDFSGKKPGYQVQQYSNTDDIEDVWKGLEASLKQQQGSFMDARNHQTTQDLVSASKGAFGGDLITNLDLPLELKEQASKAADPISKEVGKIITEFSGNDALIQSKVNPLAVNLPKFKMVGGVARLGGFLPFIGAGFDVAEAKTRIETGAKPDSSLLDKTQAAIASTTAATAVLPDPFSQTLNFASGIANTSIDIAKFLTVKTNRDNLDKGAAKSFTGAHTGRY